MILFNGWKKTRITIRKRIDIHFIYLHLGLQVPHKHKKAVSPEHQNGKHGSIICKYHNSEFKSAKS